MKNIKERQVFYHINGIKGIACLLIFFGHYIGIYKYSQLFVPTIHYIDVVYNSPFSFLIDESYWLYLFFVVSGYLVSKSRIRNVRGLFVKIINRFFRLGLPILFSHMIIFSIYKIIGFHNSETSSLFECMWYQQQFYNMEFSFRDVLLSPIYVLIFGKSAMNGPYWVLKMMFVSSVFIYIISFIFSELKVPKIEVLEYLFLIILILLSCYFYPIVAAHLIGMWGGVL